MVEDSHQAGWLLHIINAVNEAISSSFESQQILDSILDNLSRVQNIDACWVQMLTEQGDELTR